MHLCKRSEFEHDAFKWRRIAWRSVSSGTYADAWSVDPHYPDCAESHGHRTSTANHSFASDEWAKLRAVSVAKEIGRKVLGVVW